jgi:hypothetical protein
MSIGTFRRAGSTAVFAAVLLAGGHLRALAPPAREKAETQAPPVQGASKDYVFTTGAGMLFFYVKPDKSAEFEAVVKRLSEALDKTADPVRKQQAVSWHILKSVELQTDSPVYVFVFDPVVTGTDYDPVKVLSEGAPPDLQTLYTQLRDATIRVERMALSKLR